ncbi:MAG: ABC1 kinase family protein [Bacteroidia bacterium]
MKIKHLKRYRQVLKVLLKYGLDDIIDHTSLRKILPGLLLHKKMQGKYIKQTYTRSERIRKALEELGPTYIKFGQILSNRADLLPQDLIDELEKLQDAVPGFEFSDVRRIIETDLNDKIENLFAWFNETPIASASMAQVHEARLHNGQKIVVKVQRPDIADIIDLDLQILSELAELAENNFEKLNRFEPVELVKSLKKSMNRELNFLLEANNMIQFSLMFKDYDGVYIPKVYSHLSTRRVLCMEYINGIKVNNVTELRNHAYNLNEIAEKGLYIYFEQIFRHGIFHADPHPGNVLVMHGEKIALIDFGMVGVLTKHDKNAFRDFMIAITRGNFRMLIDSIEKLTKRKRIANKEELEYDLRILLDEFPPHTIDQRNISEIVERLQQIIYKHQLNFPNDFFLLLRTLVILDGISQILDPNFNTLEKIRKHSLRLFDESLSPKNLLKNALDFVIETYDYISALPKDFKTIIEKIKEGKIKIEIQGLQPLLHTLDVVSSRLAAAIILASMIIGSSLVVLSHIPPLWKGIPIIGLIGILFSGIFGIILIISIFRKGKY